MAESRMTGHERDKLASTDDVKSILGSIDDARLLDIMTLQPRITDVEQASAWLAGDIDIYGADPPLKTFIVAILAAD